MDESGNVKVPPIELIQDGANTDVTLDVIFVNFDIYMESRPYIVILSIF